MSPDEVKERTGYILDSVEDLKTILGDLELLAKDGWLVAQVAHDLIERAYLRPRKHFDWDAEQGINGA